MSDMQELLTLLREARRTNVLSGSEVAKILRKMHFSRLAHSHSFCSTASDCYFTVPNMYQNSDVFGSTCFLDCPDPHRWLGYMENRT